MSNQIVAPEIIKELLEYDAENGFCTWLPRDRKYFSDDRSWGRWNTLYAGKRAGYKAQDGYRKICVFGRDIGEHVIAWMIAYGSEPSEIDHENRNKADNRLINLRAVSKSQNMRNLSRYKSNTSGVVGVNLRPDSGLWQARIGADGGKRESLGCFDDFFDAVCARKSAELKYNYHPNHGA